MAHEEIRDEQGNELGFVEPVRKFTHSKPSWFARRFEGDGWADEYFARKRDAVAFVKEGK